MVGTFSDTWLVIPLYNEASVIASVISGALPTFPNIVCIDDGSRDSSAQAALDAGAHVVLHPINLGQGAALQTGIDFVRTRTSARYLVTFDADGQHRVQDAAAMRQRAEDEDLGFVLGSRFLGEPVECGPLRQFALRFAARFSSWKQGMNLTDTHNGLRLMRRDAFEQIHITQSRMAHASEVIRQLHDTHLPYAEQSVYIRYSDYSRSKGQSSWNAVNILMELLIR